MLSSLKLSPTASYYIRKLLDYSESALLLLPTRSESDVSSTNLDKILYHLYPEEAALAKSIQRLENLVSLHETLHTQVHLYPEYRHEMGKLQQDIFSILGLVKTVHT